MFSCQVTFDEQTVKDCIDSFDSDIKDNYKYFLKLKEKRINEFTNKANQDFNDLIDQICSNIDEAEGIYALKRIGVALNKLSSISKRIYNTESEFLKYM